MQKLLRGKVGAFLKILFLAVMIDVLLLGLFWFEGYHLLVLRKAVDCPCRVVVVEGWVDDVVFKDVARIVKSRDVERVFVVGNRMEYASALFPKHTFAEVGKLILIRYGVSEDKIIAVPFDVLRNRTLASAESLKEYLEEHNIKLSCFEILTQDIHSRRTYMVYRKVFGDRVKVGVIPINNGVFGESDWHSCSEGLKRVFAEDVAFLYYYLKLILW